MINHYFLKGRKSHLETESVEWSIVVASFVASCQILFKAHFSAAPLGLDGSLALDTNTKPLTAAATDHAAIEAAAQTRHNCQRPVG